MIELIFENGKPKLKAYKKCIEEFTAEQAEQVAMILLEWCCEQKKKPMLIVAGQKYMNKKD